MNIAVLLAGGVDPTFKMDIPKQFVNVYNKPIIVYTMQKFQNHPEVDAIMIACLKGWENMVQAYAKQFRIDKLKWVITGGVSGQDTSRLAADELMHSCKEDDIVIIHDAVRPLISQKIITDCIAKAKEYGSGLSAVRCQETIMRTEDGESGNDGIDRNDIMRVQTPQAYQYGKALWAHKEALNRGITNAVYTNTLMLELGAELHFSLGSNKNIKITTLEDIDIFKALYSTKRDAWLISKKETK